jgi:SOS-response transcriptional repressor LexA
MSHPTSRQDAGTVKQRRDRGTLRAPARQAEALRLIQESRTKRGISPSVRELCAAMGVSSTNCIGGMLASLEAKGLLTHTPRAARSYVPTASGLALLADHGALPSGLSRSNQTSRVDGSSARLPDAGGRTES